MQRIWQNCHKPTHGVYHWSIWYKIWLTYTPHFLFPSFRDHWGRGRRKTVRWWMATEEPFPRQHRTVSHGIHSGWPSLRRHAQDQGYCPCEPTVDAENLSRIMAIAHMNSQWMPLHSENKHKIKPGRSLAMGGGAQETPPKAEEILMAARWQLMAAGRGRDFFFSQRCDPWEAAHSLVKDPTSAYMLVALTVFLQFQVRVHQCREVKEAGTWSI